MNTERTGPSTTSDEARDQRHPKRTWEDARQILSAIRESPLSLVELHAPGLRIVVQRADSLTRDESPASWLLVRSPSVGRVGPAGRGGLPAVGTLVDGGTVLARLDVAGTTVDVEAPGTGVLVELSVEIGEAVEYGQVLGVVRSNA